MLIVENLQYHNFDDLSLKINAHEIVGLYGPSGSGKTLFLRALADLDAHKGTIKYKDYDQTETKPCAWRKLTSYVPAESQWWFDDVGSHFKTNDPELFTSVGFDSEVYKWPIKRLSSGEKQRLGLLRTIQRNPSVLLLDEPTSNLDPERTTLVEQMLREFVAKDDKIIIIVSHNIEQLKRLCDRIIHIKDREFIEQ